jgi:release factor glutamine methyltransferase
LFAPFSNELDGQVDLVVCNPPYISSNKVKTLPREIAAHEPQMAFDGGPLGVSLLSRLINESQRFLKCDSWLAFEVGVGQAPYFERTLRRMPGFSEVEGFPDESGIIRALAARTFRV